MSDDERWAITVLFFAVAVFTIWVIWFDRRLDYLEALANGAIWGSNGR